MITWEYYIGEIVDELSIIAMQVGVRNRLGFTGIQELAYRGNMDMILVRACSIVRKRKYAIVIGVLVIGDALGATQILEKIKTKSKENCNRSIAEPPWPPISAENWIFVAKGQTAPSLHSDRRGEWRRKDCPRPRIPRTATERGAFRQCRPYCRRVIAAKSGIGGSGRRSYRIA